MIKETLIEKAKKAMENAYVPYSKFPVGAAVLASNQKIYSGCNIENASFSLTCCAERVAIFKALSSGEQNFEAIAVVAETDQPISPCGSCRQVMNEFFSNTTKIYLVNKNKEVKTVTIGELLPYSFSANDLMENE